MIVFSVNQFSEDFMMKKVLIINQHANNLGDEAAGVALIERLIGEKYIVAINYLGEGELHYKNASLLTDIPRIKEIGIINIVTKIVANMIGFTFDGNRLLKKYSKEIDEANVVVVSPSGADLGHYTGWAALLNFMFVKSFDKKIIFCLNSIDESSNRVFEKMKRLLLNGCSIYVREKRCLDYMRKIGKSAKFGIDTAFLLKKPSEIIKKRKLIFVYSRFDFLFTDNSKKNYADIMIRYVIKDILRFAKKENKTIELLPHLLTELEEKYLMEVFRKIKEVFPYVSYNNKVKNAFDYQRAIAEAEVVISMRYHPLVLAAKNYVPFIGLSYDPKMQEVASYAGQGRYVHGIDNISKNSIYNDLTDIYRNYETVVKNIQTNIETLIYTAEQPLNEIKRVDVNV